MKLFKFLLFNFCLATGSFLPIGNIPSGTKPQMGDVMYKRNPQQPFSFNARGYDFF